jgi:UDP-N-acetylglucosamine 4-epimerase
VYNVACGDRTNLNDLWTIIKEVSGSNANAVHGPSREGDIMHSMANISKIEDKLGYKVRVRIKEGLKLAYQDFTTKHLV